VLFFYVTLCCMKTIFQYKIDLFNIFIVEEEHGISEVSIRRTNTVNTIDVIVKETPLIRRTYNELKEYLNGERTAFTVPLIIRGTEFQRRVYHALLTIEYGQTASYKDIAQQVNSPKAYRAVGNAVNKNPLGIIVPCHRVIGSDGSLVGYASGLEVKQYLLDIEQRYNIANKP